MIPSLASEPAVISCGIIQVRWTGTNTGAGLEESGLICGDESSCKFLSSGKTG